MIPKFYYSNNSILSFGLVQFIFRCNANFAWSFTIQALRAESSVYWFRNSFLRNQLTDDAWVSGPDLAPKKFLSSQQFRYLMRCKKYLKKNFLSRLVSEIQLFVYIFGWISKWPPEVRKGWLVKFFEVSYYQKNFQPPTLPNSEDR